MTDETYYSLLEVSATASMAEIRTAYRRLMSEVHPDRLANAPAYWQRKAEEKSKEINEAFGVLSNPEKRRLYDAQLGAYRGSQDKSQPASSARNSSPSSGSPSQQYSQASAGSRSGSGAGYGSAPHTPPRDQRSHANQGSATPPGGVPRSPSQSLSSGVGPRERLFFSLILALFGFGATFDFWEATSAGQELVLFVVAGGLLFAIACLYQRRISRLLSAIRLSTPRYQLLATAGAITLLLLSGRIAYKLSQTSAPLPRQLSASGPSAGPPSRSLPDSGTNSSADPVVLHDGEFEDEPIPVSLPNGTEILKRRRNGGHGKFTVDNGTANDAVVELVDVATKKAIRAFYVQSGKKFTESNIGPGNYSIYYMIGLGWDASTRQFSRSAECGMFDQTATFAEQRNLETGEVDFHDFSITLHPVVGGTAHTSELDADAFKNAMLEDGLQ